MNEEVNLVYLEKYEEEVSDSMTRGRDCLAQEIAVYESQNTLLGSDAKRFILKLITSNVRLTDDTFFNFVTAYGLSRNLNAESVIELATLQEAFDRIASGEGRGLSIRQ